MAQVSFVILSMLTSSLCCSLISVTTVVLLLLPPCLITTTVVSFSPSPTYWLAYMIKVLTSELCGIGVMYFLDQQYAAGTNQQVFLGLQQTAHWQYKYGYETIADALAGPMANGADTLHLSPPTLGCLSSIITQWIQYRVAMVALKISTFSTSVGSVATVQFGLVWLGSYQFGILFGLVCLAKLVFEPQPGLGLALNPVQASWK
ncbi:hypothetical protein BKA83DRAFT_4125834 [Pisolithus microcarpus]|nr:hypothetical protein BKA83DRAFT_4125834 [Pisolithus microcarpus]